MFDKTWPQNIWYTYIVNMYQFIQLSKQVKTWNVKKKPSSLKLSNSSYTSRALTSNDTKETQHKFHKEKKIPNSDNNDLTNKNWLPKRSLSWYRNILEQESALNENTLKIKTTHKSPGTIMRHPKHYAFYLQSNTW